MRALMIVAGLAAGVALVSGALLLQGGGSRDDDSPTRPAASGPAASRLLLREAVKERDDSRRRLLAMERRIDELTAEVEILREWASLPPGTTAGSSGTGLSLGESDDAGGDARTETDRGDVDAPSADEMLRPSSGAFSEEASTRVKAKQEAARALKDARREAELLGRVERAATTMNLIPAEKTRLEEIVRGHLSRVEELGTRARTALKDSGFGLAPADKALLTQLSRDRRSVDKQLQKDVVALVGPERYKQYQKAVRDQREKEKTLKRISRTW